MRRLFWILFGVFLCLGLYLYWKTPSDWKVIGITDGDTITVLDSKKQEIKVRLWGIDAPEKKQSFGVNAKSSLSFKTFGKYVVLEVKSKDRYGRTVANVYVGNRWINKELVEDGMAWYYRQYAKSPELEQAEHQARSAKRGLWSQQAVPPWEYRNK